MTRKRRPATTRKAKAQRPRRRPLADQRVKRGHSPRPVAVDVLTAHEAGIVAWAERTEVHGAATDGQEIVTGARLLLDIAARRAGLGDPSRCTAPQVQALVDAMLDDGWTMEDVRPALDSLLHVLEYFEDSGSWRGSAESLDDVMSVLVELMEPTAPEALVDLLEAVTVDPAAQDRALGELSLVQQADALLRWVDEGPRSARPVTATGAVRRADLAAAAAVVGWPLPHDPEGHVVPRSMADVLALDRLWRTCQAVELLETTRTLARRGGLGRLLHDGTDQERADARAVLVVHYVLDVLAEQGGPPPLAKVHGMATAGALLRLLVAGSRARTALMTEDTVLGSIGWLELARLAEVGIVRLDGDSASIVDGLQRVVAVALRLYLTEVVDEMV